MQTLAPLQRALRVGQRARLGVSAQSGFHVKGSRESVRKEPGRPCPAYPLQVCVEHILLGLICEETTSKNGYLESGITRERAQAVVEAMSGKRRPNTGSDTIAFSREVRRIFEAATNVSGSVRTRPAPCRVTHHQYEL